ncbi:hypothetical protein [Novosphingobium kaempferiae]|uniref:hypothetical protein n=1 Tax=Novosphingobium kaempferiae TaxID=2896849 RepID=UPI001E49C41D|nr:hypothetical protein [Novosphingobium kaempferiae]
MISIENDSHGRTYQIWKQHQAASCGVASAWMARGIVRQMSFAEEEWELAQRVYMGAVQHALNPLAQATTAGPMTLSPVGQPNDQSSFASTFTRFGLFARQLAEALRSEGILVEHLGLRDTDDFNHARTIAHHKIAINRPAIAMVYWQNGGAHFVVVGRATSREVTYLDPWDGHVNELANNSQYYANYGDYGVVGEILYLSLPPR